VPPSASASPETATAATAAPRTDRQAYVDVFRGLLIAHMALDHASLMFNRGRPGEELAAVAPAATADFWQFLTRFTGVPVAPGFFFMAGFMVALTSLSRAGRGVPEREITRRLVIRGLVLIAVDALIMGIPRLASGYYSFVVLSCIGASLIILAFARRLSTRILLPAALAVLVLHPLLDVSALPVPLRAVLHEPIRSGGFRSLYPIIPWVAIVVLGYVVGRDAQGRSERRPDDRSDLERRWLKLAALSLAAFLAVRLPGGYGNAYAFASYTGMDFWSFAKYPPDLAFLTWSFAAVFLALALLRLVTRSGVPVGLRPFVLYGRVPFFFYVVHFYVLGLSRALLKGRFGLPGTYLIWVLLLVVMAAPCAWYYRKKRDRPNFITRYF
jgi:uncharacterized membrane protein